MISWDITSRLTYVRNKNIENAMSVGLATQISKEYTDKCVDKKKTKTKTLKMLCR